MQVRYAILLLLFVSCNGSGSDFELPEGTTPLPEERIMVSPNGEPQDKPTPPAKPENTPDVPDKDGDGFDAPGLPEWLTPPNPLPTEDEDEDEDEGTE